MEPYQSLLSFPSVRHVTPALSYAAVLKRTLIPSHQRSRPLAATGGEGSSQIKSTDTAMKLLDSLCEESTVEGCDGSKLGVSALESSSIPAPPMRKFGRDAPGKTSQSTEYLMVHHVDQVK